MVKDSENAIYMHSNFGPTFGSGYDIKIANNIQSLAYFGHSYSVTSGVHDSRTILAGTNRFFKPDEWKYRNQVAKFLTEIESPTKSYKAQSCGGD